MYLYLVIYICSFSNYENQNIFLMCTVPCWKAMGGLRFVNTFPTIFSVHVKRFLNQPKFSGDPCWSVVGSVQSEVIE